MKYLVGLFIFFLVSLTHALEVSDDQNDRIILKKPAHRIISLSPDITEILFDIGAGSQVVGVVSGSDYPDAAKHIPRIGSYLGIDLEKILVLHPDLIVTWDHVFLRQTRAFKQFSIPVYTVMSKNLEDIARTMKNLSILTGQEKHGFQQAQQWMRTLATIKKKYHRQKTVSVFYQLGSYSLMTINQDSWINQVITFCGGHNVFANTKKIATEVSLEAVIYANPQVIINDGRAADWQKRWQAFPMMKAVKYGNLYRISPDLIERAGPRLLQGTAQVCDFLALASDKLS